jgi:ubiquinone/menaquinone biosynthesis C-methylase UbiE
VFLRENEEGRRVALHLGGGQTVLDLGAGTGFMARWLRAETGIRPTLADVVEYGNRDRTLPFVRLHDPLRLPVPDGSFDVVLLMFVLHHVERFEDQEVLIDEALRVARHRLVVVEDTPFSVADRVFNVAWDWLLNLRHGVPTPFTFRTVDGWTELFKDRSLALAHVESYRPMWPTLKSYHHTIFVLDR